MSDSEKDFSSMSDIDLVQHLRLYIAGLEFATKMRKRTPDMLAVRRVNEMIKAISEAANRLDLRREL